MAQINLKSQLSLATTPGAYAALPTSTTYVVITYTPKGQPPVPYFQMAAILVSAGATSAWAVVQFNNDGTVDLVEEIFGDVEADARAKIASFGINSQVVSYPGIEYEDIKDALVALVTP